MVTLGLRAAGLRSAMDSRGRPAGVPENKCAPRPLETRPANGRPSWCDSTEPAFGVCLHQVRCDRIAPLPAPLANRPTRPCISVRWHAAHPCRKRCTKAKLNCLVPFSLPRRSRCPDPAHAKRVLGESRGRASLDSCAAMWIRPAPGNSARQDPETNHDDVHHLAARSTRKRHHAGGY
jgi:hypothetical protein